MRPATLAATILSFTILSFTILVAPASCGAADLRLHQCVKTRISELGSRLQGSPNSGSAVVYEIGVPGVSYDIIPALRHSQVGDPVEVCLQSIPEGCPKGDDRGKVYSARNLRTGARWTLPDSQHLCGGA